MGLQGFQPFVNGTCVVLTPSLDFFLPSDIVTIVICCVLLIESLILTSIGFYFHKFPPMAAKQPLLHLIGAVAGVFWVVGNYLVNDTQVDQTWGVYCWIRRYWVAYTFGFGVFLSCLIIRFFRLYLVIIMRKKVHNILIYFSVLLSPLIIIDIVGFFVDSDESCLYVIGSGENEVRVVFCHLTTPFLYLTVIIHVLYTLIAFFFIFALRNIRKSFNEYRELRFQILIFTALYIALVVLSSTDAIYTVHGRSAVTILYALIVAIVTNSSLLIPVYKTLRKKDAFLAEFKQSLSQDAKDQVNLSMTGSAGKSSKTKQVSENPASTGSKPATADEMVSEMTTEKLDF